jgi:hypothetical protein
MALSTIKKTAGAHKNGVKLSNKHVILDDRLDDMNLKFVFEGYLESM